MRHEPRKAPPDGVHPRAQPALSPASKSWSVKKKRLQGADVARPVGQQEVAVMKVRLPERRLAQPVVAVVLGVASESGPPGRRVEQVRPGDHPRGAEARLESFVVHGWPASRAAIRAPKLKGIVRKSKLALALVPCEGRW